VQVVQVVAAQAQLEARNLSTEQIILAVVVGAVAPLAPGTGALVDRALLLFDTQTHCLQQQQPLAVQQLQ
jgi:hypothetical protein